MAKRTGPVHVVTTTRRYGGKVYHTHLLRRSYREGSIVRNETLGNLSQVLRERKKMQQKIKAMSMEAKASAAIIGSLPIVVMLLVYLTSPFYIELLWTHPVGRMMLMGCALWMLMGVLVMKKMINFDF